MLKFPSIIKIAYLNKKRAELGLNFLIEVDGAQHYKEAKLFGNNLEAQQTRDEIKNQYCKDHNYILIRIPFWEFDKKKTWKKKLQYLL